MKRKFVLVYSLCILAWLTFENVHAEGVVVFILIRNFLPKQFNENFLVLRTQLSYPEPGASLF